VDIRARFYGMQHEPAMRDLMSYVDGSETYAVADKQPYTQADWWANRSNSPFSASCARVRL
jgi:4-hydroxyphenylacetate 3-monooxygenase